MKLNLVGQSFKPKIRMQSGQAMLAQANKSSQDVLRLLQ